MDTPPAPPPQLMGTLLGSHGVSGYRMGVDVYSNWETDSRRSDPLEGSGHGPVYPPRARPPIDTPHTTACVQGHPATHEGGPAGGAGWLDVVLIQCDALLVKHVPERAKRADGGVVTCERKMLF